MKSLYAVFADLSRPLTSEEQTSVFEALDVTVPGSGYVGRDKRPNDEVYFSIEATTEDEATAQAARFMTAVLEAAGLGIEYTIQLQQMNRV